MKPAILRGWDPAVPGTDNSVTFLRTLDDQLKQLMNDPNPTRQQFLDQVNTLRENWGKQTFWEDRTKAMLALEELTTTYLTADGLTEADAVLFDATSQEFSTRAAFASTRFLNRQ